MRHLPRRVARISVSRPRPRLAMPPPSASAASSSASAASSARPPPAPSQQQQPPESPDRALPAPGDAGVTTLDVSGHGSTVKLDALGPLVVNQDGSLSRIANWAAMTPIERQNTLRILGKRNQLRLAALKLSRGDDGRGHDSDS